MAAFIRVKNMAFLARKFAYQHPLFGRSKRDKEREMYKYSVYYLWWEFLRRNEDYAKCCKSGGKGKLAALYTDFGDVHALEFKEWWNENSRGVRLFAEKLVDFNVRVIDSQESLHIEEFLMNVQIPLNLPKRFILKEFNKLLKKNHQGKRGIRTNRFSSALYPVTGHVDIAALQKCLLVHDLKISEPNLKLWQIAQKCKLSKLEHRLRNDATETSHEITDKRRRLASAADKVLRRAASIIAGTAEGKFPLIIQ
jgi:hypothetical protein